VSSAPCAADYFLYNKIMAKSISVRQKKKGRGRPATGYDPLVAARFPLEMIFRIDQWADESGVTRSEAMRRLVEQALAGADTRPMGAGAQQKAADLASREIDKMDDQTATSEERAQRKRRLVKGPREFRGDRPKSRR
jgi:hypothetical protein